MRLKGSKRFRDSNPELALAILDLAGPQELVVLRDRGNW